jgi:protein-disulfide isomerase
MLAIFKSVAVALFAFTLLLGSDVPPAMAEGSFTGDQKAEIGQIVREYLLQNPQVLQEVFDELEKRTSEQQTSVVSRAIAQNAADLFRSRADFVAGNPQGDITMVEFFDYNCPYCKKSMADVTRLIDSDKNLRVVLKEFPILGPDSVYAAKAALASRQQGKYWEFHQALFAGIGHLDQATVLAAAKNTGLDVARLQKDMDEPAVTRVITGNAKLAEALGIRGTPAFVVGENLAPGAVGFDALNGMIAALREAGGCAVC